MDESKEPLKQEIIKEEKKERLAEYKEEIVAAETETKSGIKNANHLKKPTNH